MADDIYGLTSADLLGFQQGVQQSDPYGLAGRSIASWQPNTSTWSAGDTGVASFGKAFLSSILQGYAQQNAASQLASVVNVLPQLKSDPYAVATPEGVDSGPFNMLRGVSILKNAEREALGAAQTEKSKFELLKSIVPTLVDSGQLSMQQAEEAFRTGRLPSTPGMDPKDNPKSREYIKAKD